MVLESRVKDGGPVLFEVDDAHVRPMTRGGRAGGAIVASPADGR
jgi:hypothetical protein